MTAEDGKLTCILDRSHWEASNASNVGHAEGSGGGEKTSSTDLLGNGGASTRSAASVVTEAEDDLALNIDTSVLSFIASVLENTSVVEERDQGGGGREVDDLAKVGGGVVSILATGIVEGLEVAVSVGEGGDGGRIVTQAGVANHPNTLNTVVSGRGDQSQAHLGELVTEGGGGVALVGRTTSEGHVDDLHYTQMKMIELISDCP